MSNISVNIEEGLLISKLVENEENGVSANVDYQAFNAKSTTSNKSGTLFEFSLDISDTSGNSGTFVARVFSNDNTNEIEYSDVVHELPNNVFVDVLDYFDNDDERDSFKTKLVEWATDVIETLE